MELLPAVLHALSVCAVHHPHETIRAFKVVPPVGAQRFLSPHVPNVQLVATTINTHVYFNGVILKCSINTIEFIGRDDVTFGE